MAQTVIITVNTIGPGTGPFKIYSLNNAGIVTGPFETGITRAQLLAGFVSTRVPDDAVTIRVVSTATDCPLSLDIYLNIITTTTTRPPTTTTTSTTTSTTSTSTSTTTIPLQQFIINATGITKFSFSNFSSSLDVEIDYGPTTVRVPAGQNITNLFFTYGSPYTGNIIIRSVDLTAITKLEIAANTQTNTYILPQQTGSVANPGGFPAYIKGLELAKLDGLTTLNISNTVLISAATTLNLARTLSYINILWADITGSIANLPNAVPITKTGVLSVLNFNILSGNLSTMPPSYNVISIGGDNTISGNINTLQAHVQSFGVLGKNTLTGNVAGIPNSYSSGTVSSSVLTSFNVQGYNTLSGNIREFDIERIRLLSITGEDDPNNPGVGGNTISGTIDADLIDTRLWNTNTNFTVFQILGKNTITGFMSSFTNSIGLTRISIDGKLGTSAGNTVGGSLADLPTVRFRNTTLDRLILAGANTITGDLTDISNFTVLRTIVLTGLSNITGTLSDLPISTYVLNIEGESNINTYPRRKEKANPMSKFAVKPKTLIGHSLSVAELSQLIIDLDQTVLAPGSRAWEKSELIIPANITLYGNPAFIDPQAIAALASLRAKIETTGIGTVNIIPSTARDIQITMYDCYNTEYNLYTDCETIDVGCTLYQDTYGTPVFPGYYKTSLDSYATVYEADSSGLLINISSCY